MKPLHLLGTTLFALILTIGLAGCDASDPASNEESVDGVAQLNMMLASELSLSADQYDLVEATGERYGQGDGRDPAFLWRLAQQLSTTLTAEQKAALLARAAEMAERFGERGLDGPFGRPGAEHPEGGGPMGGGMRPGGPGMGHGPNGLEQAGAGPMHGIGAILTEEQRAALHELLESFSDDREAILDRLHAAAQGERAAIAAELKALNETVRAAVEAWLEANLTDEQKAQLATQRAEREAEREAAREAVRAAIEEILGVSADQLEAIHDAFVDAVEEARLLRENGDVEAFRAAVQAAAATRDAAIQAILSPGAWEIYQIHRALAMRATHMPQGGPGGGRGMGGPPQGGPGGRRGPGGSGNGSQG